MKKLFDGDDSDSDIDIKTDNAYAKNYNNWRQKEELNKLKTVYGETSLHVSNESSSSSSEEDEDAKELTEEIEKDFFKTLACLKNRDPKIYDKNVKFFTESEKEKSGKVPKAEKPITLRDHERKLLLEGGFENLENEASEPRPSSPTLVEQQDQIRNYLLNVVHDDDFDNEDDPDAFGGILKRRAKTKEDEAKEEEEYRQWLAGKKNELGDKNEESELKPLKDYWNNPSLDENETFLRDYLLKKRFLDDEDVSYIPSYEEIVHDSDENLSEDERNIEAQEEFEHKYNFRFEEPDQEFLKRYPRTMEHSVRRKDDKRKQKRAELKERKAQERARKDEELKQLKALKRKEIEDKIQQLREITGNEQICFQDEDIEGDFDPAAHDARMQEIFNNDFYAIEEGDQKPVFPEDDELVGDDWDNWKGEQDDYAPHCEDDDFNMDCDYDPATKTSKKNDTQSMLIENSGPKRKRRRKSKFAEVLSQKKPAFNPNDKTYEEYLDEYYKLDYEDIIGDLPCRFKYKKVTPNSFGLSVEEILAAKDKELNSWCSLKKAVQIRPDHVERYDQIAYERKGKNLALKKKTLKSLYEEPEEEIHDSNNTENNEQNSDLIGRPKVENEVRDNIKRGKTDATNDDLSNGENIINSKNANINKKKKKNKDKNNGSLKPDNVIETTDVTEKKLDNDQLGVESKQTIILSRRAKKNKKNKQKIKANANKVVKMKSKVQNQNDEVNLSESRLRAYGINPKKFRNKQKIKNKSRKLKT